MEFADKLLQYKNNRTELISKIVNVYTELNIKLPTLYADEDNNSIIPLDIDPFSVFALFNKGITDLNRIRIIKQFGNEFSINAPAPNNFDGIPLVNNMSATFYAFDEKRGDDDIDNLWKVFEYAIKLSGENLPYYRDKFIEYYNACLSQFGVKWNLTMGLYWIRPYVYINLDSSNREILSSADFFPDEFRSEIKSMRKPPLGDRYLEICQICADVIDKSHEFDNFSDFSHEAYVSNKSEVEKTGIGDDDVETVHYWIYSPGERAYKWDEFYTDGIMGLACPDCGNLKEYSTKEDIKLKLQEIHNDNESHRNDVNAFWQIANEIRVGDIIFAKRGLKEIVGRGIVESDYIYDELRDFQHVRKVNWTHDGIWAYDENKFPIKAITDITDRQQMVKSIEELVGAVEPPKPHFPKYSIENFLNEVYIDEDDYATLFELLLNKKNLIVQGAPGVGKTFMAKRLAYSIMGEKDVERVMMVQFHQSYSYEDFVMGYRPSKEGFELRNGAFYEFCKKAEDDSENDYFFIIDEINRGNLSKIFGELFMLIENDKRGEKNKIQLLYSDELFFIPKNVYIIGLMNTADRSLAMIDYALRRRFTFFDLKPGFKSDGFRSYQESLGNSKFNRLIKVMEELNEDIENDESLGEGFRIGHSYLCNIESEIDKKLKYVVEYELIPLLKEYWFDEPLKVDLWSEKLRSVIDDIPQHDLY